MSVTEPVIHSPPGRLSDVEHMTTHSFHREDSTTELLKGISDGCLIYGLPNDMAAQMSITNYGLYPPWHFSLVSGKDVFCSFKHLHILINHQINSWTRPWLKLRSFHYPECNYQLLYHILYQQPCIKDLFFILSWVATTSQMLCPVYQCFLFISSYLRILLWKVNNVYFNEIDWIFSTIVY